MRYDGRKSGVTVGYIWTHSPLAIDSTYLTSGLRQDKCDTTKPFGENCRTKSVQETKENVKDDFFQQSQPYRDAMLEPIEPTLGILHIKDNISQKELIVRSRWFCPLALKRPYRL